MTTLYIILAIIALIYLISDIVWEESGTVTTLCTIVGLMIFYGTTEINLLEYIDNYITLTWMFILYLFIGVIWSIIKWYFYVSNHYKKKSYVLIVGDNKDRIINWISYWPLSILSYLMRSLTKDLFSYLYSKIENIYEKIAEAAQPKK